MSHSSSPTWQRRGQCHIYFLLACGNQWRQVRSQLPSWPWEEPGPGLLDLPTQSQSLWLSGELCLTRGGKFIKNTGDNLITFCWLVGHQADWSRCPEENESSYITRSFLNLWRSTVTTLEPSLPSYGIQREIQLFEGKILIAKRNSI
jgi:hypothetical protein